MRIYAVLNKLAESFGAKQEVIETLVPELKDGYTIKFPLLAMQNRVVYSVALLFDNATFSGANLRGVEGIAVNIPTDATHTVVFLAFHKEKQYLRQCKKLTKYFPERD